MTSYFNNVLMKIGFKKPEKYDNSKAIVPAHYFSSLMLESEMRYYKGTTDKFASFEFESYNIVFDADKVNPELMGYDVTRDDEEVEDNPELAKGEKVCLIMSKHLLKAYPEKVHLFMGGSGGYYSYYLGVASVLQRNFNLDNVVFSGVSGGAMVNLFLALNKDIDSVFNDWNVPVLHKVSQFKFGALFNWNQVMLDHFHKFVEEDAHLKVKNKYYVYTSEFYYFKKWQNRMIDNWTNNEELGKAILASCQIPFLFGGELYTIYRNERFVDGCFTYTPEMNNHQHMPTIKIYANSWRPYKTTWLWCWTSVEWHQKIFKWGQEDASQNLPFFKDFLMPK